MAPLVVVSLLVALLVWSWSISQTPRYESTAKMVVGQRQPPSECAHGICLIPNSPLKGIETFTRVVAKAVTTTAVAEHATDRLNLPEGSVEKVLENTSARADPGTPIVDVTYTSTNPKTAQLTANAIGKALSEKISEVSLGPNGITVTVWSEATLPKTPVSPHPVRNGLIALVAALTLSAGLLAGSRALGRGSQLR
jgi:capsular polysaccharide biosynthesis protein